MQITVEHKFSFTISHVFTFTVSVWVLGVDSKLYKIIPTVETAAELP